MKLEKSQLAICLFILSFFKLIESKYTWNGKEWAWHEDNYKTIDHGSFEGSGEPENIFIDEETETEHGSGSLFKHDDIILIIENLQRKAQDLSTELSELKSYLENKVKA